MRRGRPQHLRREGRLDGAQGTDLTSIKVAASTTSILLTHLGGVLRTPGEKTALNGLAAVELVGVVVFEQAIRAS